MRRYLSILLNIRPFFTCFLKSLLILSSNPVFRIEEAKRAIKRPISNDRYDDDRDRDRKRTTSDSRRFEAPPPPRFETSSVVRYAFDFIAFESKNLIKI